MSICYRLETPLSSSFYQSFTLSSHKCQFSLNDTKFVFLRLRKGSVTSVVRTKVKRRRHQQVYIYRHTHMYVCLCIDSYRRSVSAVLTSLTLSKGQELRTDKKIMTTLDELKSLFQYRVRSLQGRFTSKMFVLVFYSRSMLIFWFRKISFLLFIPKQERILQ